MILNSVTLISHTHTHTNSSERARTHIPTRYEITPAQYPFTGLIFF